MAGIFFSRQSRQHTRGHFSDRHDWRGYMGCHIFQKDRQYFHTMKLDLGNSDIVNFRTGRSGLSCIRETAQVSAACGPVGDCCNTVQQSEYARLFGILPIGVMGLLGYVAILISWRNLHMVFASAAFMNVLMILTVFPAKLA